MDNIVQQTMGLFGPTPQELEAARQNAIAKQYASYGQLGGKAGIGGVIGTAIGQGLASLFGTTDPELKRASDMKAIQDKVATDLSPEEMANPTIYFPHLVNTLKDAGYTKEALQFGQIGAQHIADWKAAQLKQEESQANINLAKANIAEKGIISKKIEQEMKPKVQVLREQRAEALLQGNEELAKNLDVEIQNELFSKITPQNQAEQGVLNDFVKKAGGDFSKGSIAFAGWKHQQELDKIKETAKIKAEADQQPTYKTYNTLEEKLNDTSYGVANGKVPSKEQTIARRVTTDAKEASTSINQLMTLTQGGQKNITGTIFANVKDNGFFSATGVSLAHRINNKESEMYDAIMYPLVKAQMLLNNPDYRPTEADVKNGMNSYKAGSGQSHIVQLQRMAELRKNYEAAAETQLDAHIMNAASAQTVRNSIKEVQRLIPWSVEDVVKYSNSPESKTVPFNKWLESSTSSSQVPQKAIDMLKANPSLASKFDSTFGVGASAKYLKE